VFLILFKQLVTFDFVVVYTSWRVPVYMTFAPEPGLNHEQKYSKQHIILQVGNFCTAFFTSIEVTLSPSWDTNSLVTIHQSVLYAYCYLSSFPTTLFSN
jgi:hypothetical protein